MTEPINLSPDLEHAVDAAQKIAHFISDGESAWSGIRSKLLNLVGGEEPCVIRHEFDFQQTVSHSDVRKALERIGARKYSGLPYEHALMKIGGHTHLFYPGHYSAYIDNFYLNHEGRLFYAVFLRNPRDVNSWMLTNLQKDSREIYEEVRAALETS